MLLPGKEEVLKLTWESFTYYSSLENPESLQTPSQKWGEKTTSGFMMKQEMRFFPHSILELLGGLRRGLQAPESHSNPKVSFKIPFPLQQHHNFPDLIATIAVTQPFNTPPSLGY